MKDRFTDIDRKWWLILAGSLFVFQFICLQLTTPMYALDTNSYIQGVFTWSIYHNPLSNIVFGVLSKIWSSAGFIATVQILIYSLAVTYLALYAIRSKQLQVIATAIAAIEPATMFYNFSLLSESLYTSMTLMTVAGVIIYIRKPSSKTALLFGAFAGAAFLARLSGNLYIALLPLVFLAKDISIPTKIRHFFIAGGAFSLCYAFVGIGQSIINDGALYTVKGRVLWDFTSSYYDPAEVDSDEFNSLVAPLIVADDSLLSDREIRREYAYLGYKDCLAAHEDELGGNGAIGYCDSLFGDAAMQIRSKHFGGVFKQFIADNLYDIHNRSYLEERFTDGMHFYHDESEWEYLDSLMAANYDLNLQEEKDNIPGIWKSLAVPTFYSTILFYFWILGLIAIAFLKFRGRLSWLQLIVMFTVSLPFVFHLVYISYRFRFWAPVIMLLWIGLISIAESLSKRTH